MTERLGKRGASKKVTERNGKIILYFYVILIKISGGISYEKRNN